MLKMFKKPDIKEQVRESQRELKKGTRDVDREIMALRREEEKLVKEIKAAAKAGNQPATRVLAKSLVRLRGQITKLQGSAAQLKGIGTTITTAAATANQAKAIASATKTMTAMQAAMDPAKINQTMQNFAKENARMDMVGEMMGDAMDDALDGDGVDEETDELVGAVLDEIGIDLATSMQAAPKQRQAGRAPAEAAGAGEDLDDDLVARLANLKAQ
ncbi:hypothetical protein HYH03_014371 [Edaphochlamys debaryana]|uniref:Uncharacterized protein n=1 Tax=Edaphochlamys debaryana TaxID=47281 RepID=A0A836BTM7_9CHLO|nr:hypothetical protein HYH03_014371 [Edaphochlamys debaryana]|eukprot:KAG2486999.1 hypothetical protein HYH03_014371 [Edaphochlamys debaryana]